MDLTTVKIDKPEAINFILGQSHFIKTVEDMHEALVSFLQSHSDLKIDSSLHRQSKSNFPQ